MTTYRIQKSKAAEQASAETMELLFSALPLDGLDAHIKALNKTRQKLILYGLNGFQYRVARSVARDLAVKHRAARSG